MATKRKDKSRVVLKTGEVQRKDGTYQFSWQDSQMKRRFVYARTLDDLNLMCYFLILAATRLDIHLQQECVKLE